MAKITSSDAKILARLLERYVLDTSRSLQYGLREHPENPMNKLLLVELVEDMTVARKLYPMFAEGLNLDEQAKERTKRYNLPIHEIKEQAAGSIKPGLIQPCYQPCSAGYSTGSAVPCVTELPPQPTNCHGIFFHPEKIYNFIALLFILC